MKTEIIKNKQAVVLIHGIGEQKPMTTLRSFVEAVLPDGNNHSPENPVFKSQPDPISELMEVRKLTYYNDDTDQDIDFYEYYWQYQTYTTPGVRPIQIFFWLISILFRPWRWSVRSIFPFLALWLLIISFLIFLGLYIPPVDFANITFINLVNSFDSINTIVSMIAVIILTPFSYLLVHYLGDAEQYLRPKPKNIAFRQRIRSDGLKLLQRLHEQDYNKIVLVGHSLGSVIGYDLIKHLWIRFNKEQRKSPHFESIKKSDFENKAKEVSNNPTEEIKTEFSDSQFALWEQQNYLSKTPWLISDFITLGSPLVHAKFLLAESSKDLELRMADYEIPTCPPKGNIFYDYEGYSVPHHAAPFACVRWTNIYFAGDFIAGKLSNIFGNGIVDIKAKRSAILDRTILSHIKYWKPYRFTPVTKYSGIEYLQRILGLK